MVVTMEALRRRRTSRIVAGTTTCSGALLVGVAAVVVALLHVSPAAAHNLDASAVYASFDQNTQAMLEQRIAGGWTPGDPLLENGDELGILIKAIPDNGTNTGVGGYTTFYIPDGVQVIDAAYLQPGNDPSDGIDGYDKVPMKGQALMPNVGAGGGPTVSLVGIVRGPNVAGVTAPLVSALNVNNGTLPAVYGDLGIFYSTSPATAYGSYTGGTLKNNSGDTVGWRTSLGTPLNEWDAWQLAGYGIAGTTNPAYPSTPLLDSNGRGNTGWGLASAVAGPESGYAWEFDLPAYAACDPAPYAPSTACLDAATQDVGPWNRIRYPGSQIAFDLPGDKTLGKFNGGLDASDVGFDLAAGDLPPTTGQSDGTPNAIRWAYGQLTLYTPEFVWVKIKVQDYSAILDPSGCPLFHVDTFGGDAGGDDNGKDHIWRYYDPNSTTWNGCLAVSKPADRDVVKVGDTLQYALKVYNLGVNPYSQVVVRDTLPSGATFLSAVPAQDSGPNPLVWNVGTLQPGQAFEATVSVKAASNGILTNTICAQGTPTSGPDVEACAQEKTSVGAIPLLAQNKTVSPASVAAGGSVQYTITIENVGGGSTGNPVTITELLPEHFTYVGPITSAVVNGANVTGLVGVDAGNPNQPEFTVPAAIQPGKSLVLVFQAAVAADAASGEYCNSYITNQNGTNISTGSLACVDVGGGTIGDTVFRDWDDDGVRDPDEEGLPGVTVTLYGGACPPSGPALDTKVSDAAGFYQFTGLTAGTYCVVPSDPSGHTLTTGNAQTTVTLATGEKRNDVDFGYLPGGTGSIGDTVFEDVNADGVFDGADVGIAAVTVSLYEDTNGNGTIDAGDSLVAVTVTGAGGAYLFSGLATGIDYLVDVLETDPDLSAHFGGAPNVVQTTPGVHDVGTLAGAYSAADFGFYETVPGSIGDDVFVDLDDDGVRDPGESGLPNVTVRIYADSNGNGVVDPGEPLIDTVETDSNGKYAFTDLPAGDYVVDVDETDADIPPQLLSALDPIAVTLGSGEARNDVDFPFVTGLTKTVDKAYDDPTVTPNELNYTLAPRNSNGNLLSAAQVTDLIPAGTTYVSSNSDGQPLDNDDPPDGVIEEVLWEIGSNVPGAPGYLGGTADPACTMTLTVYADADAWIDENNPDDSNGTQNTLTTSNNAGADKVGLLHFDVGVSTLPLGATVLGAELQLTVSGGSGTNREIEIHELGTSFNEAANADPCTTGAAWQGPACTDDWAAGDFSASDYAAASLGTIAPTSNGTFSVSGAALTGVVSSWLAGGVNDGLSMIPVGTATNNTNWRSREDGNQSLRPQIVITYGTSGCSGQTILRETGAGEVADTYIQEDSGGNDNYGTAASMKVRPEDGKHKHALVAFDLSGIPAGVDIDSAVMQVTVRTDKADQTQSIHRMVTPWEEGTNATDGAQWNDPNGTGTPGVWAGGAFSSLDYDAASLGIFTPRPKGAKTADVTALVQGWYDGTFSNEGVVLLSAGTSTADAEYYSSQDGTAARRPTLTVSWSVEPSDASGSNTMTTGWTLAQNGDSFPVTMTLTNTGSEITGVSPSSMTVVGVNGADAACGAAVPASQTVPAGGSAQFAWTCTITSVGATPGSVTFRASAGDGSQTWSAATSNSVLVSPLLQMQVVIDNPPGVDVVTNAGELYDGEDLLVSSNEVNTALTAAIGDFVWVDVNSDGVQDPGEGGLAGVRVFLDEDGDCQYDPGELYDTSAADGTYLIAGLGTGSYEVCLDLTTLPPDYYPTTSSSLSFTVAVSGEQITTADFGVNSVEGPAAASIGDTIWLDADEDGVVGPGEEGLAGVAVELYADANGNGVIDGGDYVVDTAVTDAGGHYLFPNLPAGDYLVLVDETSVVTTPFGVPTTLADAMDLVAGTNAHAVTVAAGEEYLDADFGYDWSGSIGDFAWYDKDGDGSQDGPGVGCNDSDPSHECGAPDMTAVLVYDLDGNGVADFDDPIVAVAVTDSDGHYLFDNLPPGNYVVQSSEQEVPAPGSSAHAGQIGFMVPSTAAEVAVSLAPGQAYADADFGFVEAAKLEGSVFYDPDRNGIFDPSENGLGGVTVTLSGLDADLNPITLVTVTAPDGSYSFLVPAGNYTVTYDAGATGYPDATNATSLAVSPLAGQEIVGLDFGRDDDGRIGDRVWNDADGDGVQDGSESGLAGVTVLLYLDPDGDGDLSDAALVDVQATDAFGAYSFLGLAETAGAERYFVVVDETTVPSGFVQSGDPDEAGTCATCDGRGGPLPLASGEQNLLQDFGYRVPAQHSVSGYVFRDDSLDGVRDGGEPGLGAGITVEAAVDADGDGTVDFTVSTVTDATGLYEFAGLPEGADVTITIDESTLPAAYYQRTDDADGGSDATIVVADLAADVTDRDFGYVADPGSIAGTVCFGEGDGQCDVPEPGASGATVTLVWAGPDGVLGNGDDVEATTTIGGGGDYLFDASTISAANCSADPCPLDDGLPPGVYSIRETNPPGALSVADADGGNPDAIALVLAVGQTATGQDFEDELPAPPRIGVSKSVSDGPHDNGDGSYTLTYRIDVTNPAATTLTAVQVSENLAAAFAGALGFTVDAVTSAQFTVNLAYDGALDDELLTGADSLAAAETATIFLTVTVEPGANVGPYWNTAIASGQPPEGPRVSDDSDSGLDPDPDATNPGQPGDTGGTDDPTPVLFELSRIGVSKGVWNGPLDNGDGTFTLTYRIDVTNAGGTALSALQVTENLVATFAGSAGFVVDTPTSPDFTVNGAFDGSSDTELLAGADSLAVGASGTIFLTVTVNAGGNYGPYYDTAIASAQPPTGPRISDQSDSGFNPDPDNTNPGEPGDSGGSDDPTPVLLEQSRIGVAKNVADGPVDNGDGTFTLTYGIYVTNSGATGLTGLHVTEDLAATFAGSGGFGVDLVTSASLTVNSAFDGSADIELLTGADSLAAGDDATIFVTVTVTPGGNTGPYLDTAVASAQPPTGPRISDHSDSGVNPDPDNPNPGEPGDTGGTDDPTPVTFEPSRIGVSKEVSNGPADNGDGTFTLTYRIRIANAGTTTLADVQVTENLGATFVGAAGFTIDAVASPDLNVNPSYDGTSDTALLAGVDSLAAGETATVFVAVTVTPGGNYGPYLDTAVASAQPPTGPRISDLSDSGAGPDPDDTNPGQPGDTGGTDDPTPVSFEPSRIGVSKEVSNGPVDNGDGTFTLTYRIMVLNAGATTLGSVQLQEDLAATFAGAGGFTLDTVGSPEFAVNPTYDGASDTALLAPGNTLAAAEFGSVFVTVTVTPAGNYGPYLNTAVASAQPPTGSPVSDESDSGANPDPDDTNPGEPGDSGGSDDPTPVSFESARIGVAKAVSSGPDDNGDGTFTLTYAVRVTNAGSTTLAGIGVTDDLTATFAGSGGFTADAVASPDFAVNAGFDGAGDTELLAPGNDMAPGQSGTIFVTVTVTPAGNYGPYLNSAAAAGVAPSLGTVSDDSDSGVHPEPDNSNPGEPGDTGGTDDPTPVSFDPSRIGVSKAVTYGPVANGDGTVSLTYTIRVRNAGTTSLADVQVSEDLSVTFAGAAGFVVDGVASALFAVNSAFDGALDTNLLTAGNSLPPGQTGSILLSVTVTPAGNLGPYLNTAIATAQAPTGPPISDDSDSGLNSDPDNSNPGQPGDTGGTDDPTPVLLDACSGVDCDDGVACTADSCNAVSGLCEHAPQDSACDDGAFCNGVETCDATDGCLAGTAVDCADAVACTVDSCDEATDSCVHAPDHASCTNGAYCDGAEICDVVNGCVAGTPVVCDDGDVCTADSCDEAGDQCLFEDVCCGNGVLDPGEACDPSDPSVSEVCGNMIDDDLDGLIDCADPDCESGGCTDQCTLMAPCQCIAKDPSVVQTRFPGLFKFHGRVVGSLPNADPQLGVKIMLAAGGDTLYTAELPPDSFVRRGKFYFYRDKKARNGVDPPGPHAGLVGLRVRFRLFDGVEYVTLYVKAYADFTAAAESCMTTQIQIGNEFGILRTDWTQLPTGWRLRTRDYDCSDYNSCEGDPP